MTAKKRLLPILVALVMAFTMMPMMGASVYADDPAMAAPGIALGADVLSVGSNTSGAATVHMADKTWRVIGYGGEGVASSADIMTLISAGNLKIDVQFRADGKASDANHYSKSNLKTEIEKLTGTGTEKIFSDGEKAGIAARDLASGDYIGTDTDCIAGDEVKGAFLWPLSTKEANALNSDLRRLDGGTNRDWVIDYWWLRSPGHSTYTAADVEGDGNVGRSGLGVVNGYGVRPAFNFDLTSVLFTSAAEGGKTTGEAGPNVLTAISDNTTNEWKLTLKDKGRSFKASAATGATLEMTEGYSGWSVPIVYSGARTGDNEYVSVILCDSKGTAKYYGNIAQNSAASSDAGQAVNIPEGLAAGTYTMYVFNEQINGDKLTDYASEFSAIELTVNPIMVDASLELSVYDADNNTWLNADDPVYVKSAAINGTDTRNTRVPAGVKATITITPADGYMVSGVSVNGSHSPWKVVQDFRSWTDQETGIHTITFTPAEGESYAFSVSLHEAVRVIYDLNGGTVGDDWLGNTRLESKGSVVSSIADQFEKITPPAGKVLSAVEITTASWTNTIAAADLNSTAHSYDADVTFKCIWGSNQPEPQPATQTITASNVTKTYGNAAFSLGAKTNGDGTLTYKSSNTKVATVDSAGKATIKGVGTAKITISASATANYKAASKTITVTVNKASNPLKIGPKTATVKYSKLKKKAQTLAVTKVMKFTKNAKDKKTYTLVSEKKGSKSFKKYFKINKTTGKVTVKKGLKKGTYKVKVKVQALGNSNYKASAVKSVTFTVKVK